MINRIKSYLFEGSRFYGLEVYHVKENLRYNLVLVKRKNQELTIQNQWRFAELEGLFEQLEKNIPLCLALNSDSVLSKKIPSNPSIKGHALISSAFPSLDFDKIYYQVYSLRGQRFASITRKDEINGILEKIKEHKVPVLNLSLGLSSLFPLIGHIEETTVKTSNQVLDFKTEKNPNLLTKQESVEEHSYSMNGIQVKNTELLAFGTILMGLLEGDNIKSNAQDLRNQLRNDYKEKRFLTLFIRFSLGLVLLVLLTNFLVFSEYSGKVNDMRQEQMFSENSVNRLQKVKEEVELKEKRLAKALINSNSRVSYYLDKLGQSAPGTILLSNLTYQPLKKPVKNGNPIEYIEGTIYISGITSDHKDFSNWIVQLENMKWIERIKTTEYDYETPKSSFFKLLIVLNHENEK
ncbi:hypothetical protein [Flagellimonas sp.]|uniref:hypothetical protein n=1 Tax=Flagellimonas sp. TaxID=2058762 RepID=UPI003F4A74A5